MRPDISFWLAVAISASLLTGCQKNIPEPDPLQQASIPQGQANTGPRLSYGDTLFFLRNQPGNASILPVSKPTVSGYFASIPRGLSMDSTNGRINLNLSETGMRYKVYYVSSAGLVLDSVKLVISGIDYADEIFEIASTPNNYDTSFPVYNARPDILLPCGDNDDDGDGDLDDDDNTCVFDETDLDGDGNDDIAGVIQDKLLVDIKKGTIDVEASFNAGIFGSSTPANGISRDFTIYYRLQDASNRALNKITVRVYHYRKKTDIPQSLLDIINERKKISGAVNNRMYKGAETLSIVDRNQAAGMLQAAGSDNLNAFEFKPKRPPIIVIVSQ